MHTACTPHAGALATRTYVRTLLARPRGRYVTWFFIGILSMGRMDVLVLPKDGRGLHVLDTAFAAYVALARQDHQYNHPVVNVFFQLQLQQLEQFRSASVL